MKEQKRKFLEECKKISQEIFQRLQEQKIADQQILDVLAPLRTCRKEVDELYQCLNEQVKEAEKRETVIEDIEFLSDSDEE